MTTWFITGISRGLGLALAEAALARGDTVIGTVRGERPAISETSGTLRIIPLDLGDRDAIAPAVEQAFAEADGRIDVIVNNAGYGLLGAMEKASDAEMDRLFAVDLFGPIALIRAALPRLRTQGSGHVINITSIAGRAPGLGSALYSTAKAALEGLTASLSQELAPFGIKVSAVAPGAFRTDFLSTHSIRKSADEGADYAATVGRGKSALDTMAGKQLGDPVRAAEAILRLADSPEPPVHLLLGSDALTRARAKLDAMIDEIDTWEDVTRSTDFPAAD